MHKLFKAFCIAVISHKGQVDKGGKPYIFHPIRVALNVKGIRAKTVALLHDVIEDNPKYTISDFSFLDREQQEALVCLTHDKGVEYSDYISRIKTNKLATLVKISDLKDNTNISRLKNITEKDILRLEKYNNALSRLI